MHTQAALQLVLHTALLPIVIMIIVSISISSSSSRESRDHHSYQCSHSSCTTTSVQQHTGLPTHRLVNTPAHQHTGTLRTPHNYHPLP